MTHIMPAEHLCSMCGQPTTSKYAMCQRPGACSREYRRLWNRDQPKKSRNETVRRYRRSHRSAPFVYAISFPVPVVLKIGLTTSAAPGIFMGIARRGARVRGWDTTGSLCIWKQPGDVRVEAWMQAVLAFRWPGAFGKHQNRICEWFNVSGLTASVVIGALTEVYQAVPADLVSTTAASSATSPPTVN